MYENCNLKTYYTPFHPLENIRTIGKNLEIYILNLQILVTVVPHLGRIVFNPCRQRGDDILAKHTLWIVAFVIGHNCGAWFCWGRDFAEKAEVKGRTDLVTAPLNQNHLDDLVPIILHEGHALIRVLLRKCVTHFCGCGLDGFLKI